MKNLWIVYDERAQFEDTFDCVILESCNSEYEAMYKALPGIVFKYDINEESELINETLIGPNFPLQIEWK